MNTEKTLKEKLWLAYWETVCWTEEEEIGKDPRISKKEIEKVKDVLLSFWKKYLALEVDYLGHYPEIESVMHDFWLNRNHHGTGFWDKEDIYGEENAKKLDKLSKEFGESNAYVGNGGWVYFDRA